VRTLSGSPPQGYEVHLVDASSRLVDEARVRSARAAAPIASLSVADARSLPQEMARPQWFW
jgi:hypothetical protein